MRKKQTEISYRRAFQVFYEKAQQVQALSAFPDQDPETYEAALIELEAAHVAYEENREAWVKLLLESSGEPVPTKKQLSHSDDEHDIAESVAIA